MPRKDFIKLGGGREITNIYMFGSLPLCTRDASTKQKITKGSWYSKPAHQRCVCEQINNRRVCEQINNKRAGLQWRGSYSEKAHRRGLRANK